MRSPSVSRGGSLRGGLDVIGSVAVLALADVHADRADALADVGPLRRRSVGDIGG